MRDTAIVWIRNDLRLHDNPALYAATCLGGKVLLVYIFESLPLEERASCVWHKFALEAFGLEAKNRGFGWTIRKGTPSEVLRTVHREVSGSDVLWNRRYEQSQMATDDETQKVLEEEGIRIHTFPGNLLIEPKTLVSKNGKPYQVFTPYYQAFQKEHPDSTEVPEACPKIPYRQNVLESVCPEELLLFPQTAMWPKKILHGWHASEEGAKNLLEHFCSENLMHYGTKRDLPAADVTSRLSPYLHFGQISIRRIWNSVLDALRKCKDQNVIFQADAFFRQLVWRDFSHMALYYYPKTVQEVFREKFSKICWRSSADELRAWQYGKTGYPIIDAGMRQLYETGFMHNRVRLIVASFLVKQMLHSWHEGQDWFMKTLFDADPANNTFGWQWVLGSGVDAAPSFYIFNPVLQGKKFDPDGAYVRSYVPELTLVPSEYIHRPFEATEEQLSSWNVRLGMNYSRPIVDLEMARRRALKVFANL